VNTSGEPNTKLFPVLGIIFYDRLDQRFTPLPMPLTVLMEREKYLPKQVVIFPESEIAHMFQE